MSRWKPNTKSRLEQAALELYQKRGYEQTTVKEIAERAGLTERTFFRYFVDKREVLFSAQEDLFRICVSAIENAPVSATPIEIIIAALEAVVPIFQERHEIARQRQSVIAANPELQEREMLKFATLISAMSDALRRRPVMEPVTESVASLTVNIGAIVFKTAYARWVDAPDAPDLSILIRASFDQLKRIISG